jgi:hypothetical protein
MIIKTDVRNISISKPPMARNAADVSQTVKNRQPDSTPLKDINNRLRIDRSLGDALSIAQMSQNIIQRAMAVSLRLKNIASTAIASGNVNTQALSEALSDIRSALSNFGEQVPNPVQLYTIPSAKNVEMPEIRGEMKSIRDITHNLENGNYAQAGRIESVYGALNDKLKAFRATEDKITALMKEMTAGYASNDRAHSGELASHVKAVIIANPEYALAAQGNINHDAAGRLMI